MPLDFPAKRVRRGPALRLRGQNPAVNAVVTAMGFASGGIMTTEGPVQTTPYNGGITSDISVALFGEGSQPEAYVPLPDGRSIPVTLSLPANDDSDRNGETLNALHLAAGGQSRTCSGIEKPQPGSRRAPG